MADGGGTFKLTGLIDTFSTANQSTTSALNALTVKGKGTDINVGDYMKLQLQMNQLSQIGQLITSTVGAVNHMVQTAIQNFQSR
jgi:hypothetical protein